MCLGIPVQIIESNGLIAHCRGRNGDEMVNLALIGQQPAGTWLLNVLGSARTVLTEEEAFKTERALDAIAAVLAGEEIDMEHCFPDLVSAQS